MGWKLELLRACLIVNTTQRKVELRHRSTWPLDPTMPAADNFEWGGSCPHFSVSQAKKFLVFPKLIWIVFLSVFGPERVLSKCNNHKSIQFGIRQTRFWHISDLVSTSRDDNAFLLGLPRGLNEIVWSACERHWIYWFPFWISPGSCIF